MKLLDIAIKKGSNFVSIFLPDDLVANVTTDADGYASIQTNYYQVLHGSVNPPPYNKGTTANYQHASFDAYPIRHGEMRVAVFWGKIGEIGGPSMHEYHLEHFIPGKETLVIFLPRKGGTDKFTY